MMPPRQITGLSVVIDEADAFLVDQFGTLHDGMRAYPGAAEALRALRRTGKRIAILSNSGKRNAANEARLARLGFPRDTYDVFLSSGEAAWRMLTQDRPAALRNAETCFLLSRDGDTEPLQGLDLRLATRPENADLLLLAGSEAERRSLSDYADLLLPAALRHVPCLCTNPDRTMLAAGGLYPGAGRIAELYEELGGEVIWFGKPYRPIYEMALQLLRDPPRRRVFGVGDSVEHDVAGAASAGCRSALVLTGIAEGWTEADVAEAAARYSAVPTVVLTRFTL